MPELPEVETVKTALVPAMSGKKIVNVKLNRPDLRRPFPENFAKQVSGALVESLTRRAKYIIVNLDNNLSIVMHLGMSGQVLVNQTSSGYNAQKHDHMILAMDDDSLIVFHDPRRFGMVFLVRQDKFSHHQSFKNLGPEPLENHFSGPVLYNALRKRKCSVKNALLNQNIVAGIGNIYASEALFYANINPERRSDSLSLDEAERLVRSIRDVLRDAIKSGGSSLRDFRNVDGNLGYFQHNFAVYNRCGQACPSCVCNIEQTGGIHRIVQSGRATFFCKEKQK
jgi:formamidopyrimidine-DNA glycosylase